MFVYRCSPKTGRHNQLRRKRRSLRRADDFWQAILTQHLGGRRLGKAIENGEILTICYYIDILIYYAIYIYVILTIKHVTMGYD